MNICIQKVFVGIENKADLFCKRANRSQVIFPCIKTTDDSPPPTSPRTTPKGDKVETFRNTKFLSFCFCHRIFESSNLFQ